MTTANLIIRKYKPEDEKAIINVCYSTTPHVPHPKFNDPYLFSLRWALYYVYHEPDNCIVMEDTDKKKVVGYIIGSENSLKMEETYEKKVLPLIKQRICRKYWMHPILSRTYRKVLAQSNRYTEPLKSLAVDYPAHLHIDILPEYQGHRMGKKLMTTFEEHMKSIGNQGIHLGVSKDNPRAIHFYEKTGYKVGLDLETAIFFVKKLNG